MTIAQRNPPFAEQLSLPENILNLNVSQRAWNGVRVDVTEFNCEGRVIHRLPHANEARLSVLLEEVGSRAEPRLNANQPCPIPYMPRHMHFAPVGMEVWGFSADARFVRDATLLFDLPMVSERFFMGVNADAITTPRLRFTDDRIWPLVKMLADVVNDPDPSVQLYGDGLATAITACLFAKPSELSRNPKGLAPWQLRRVIDYMEAQLPQRIELAHLAEMLSLSQAHFSRAFKASTGLAPYRWQLDSRIRRAQELLLHTRASLDQVAEATGFADGVHLGRTFRKHIGVTPAVWRHDRKK